MNFMFTLVSEAAGKVCLRFDGGSMNVHMFGGHHKLSSLIKLNIKAFNTHHFSYKNLF